MLTVMDSRRECGYCKRKVIGDYCGRCMADFKTTPDLDNMTRHEKQEHLIAMRKSEIPHWLIRRRLSEILDRSIDPIKYMDYKWFRHMYESIQDY